VNDQYKKGFHPIYILAGFYALAIYIYPVIFAVVNSIMESEKLAIWSCEFPLFLGIINLIVVILLKDKVGRIRLLNCAILIKYSLIPLYIVGGLTIVLSLLLMLTPVVIMVFVGPTIATTLSILGWIAMVGAAPFSVGYIWMSYKEKIHGKFLSVITSIFQFFFTVDVISMMVLALKEKRCVKVTIAWFIILILAIVASIIWIGTVIIGAVSK
jgi:hypothetical protein